MRILLLLKVFRLRSGKLDAHRLWRSTAVIGNKPPDQKNFLPKKGKIIIRRFRDCIQEQKYRRVDQGLHSLHSVQFFVSRRPSIQGKYSNVHII